MSREGVHVRYQLCLQCGGSSTTYALAKGDGLTSNLALEWTEDQLLRICGINDVEAAPIDG